MIINILGTEYKIRTLTEDEYPKLKTANGLAELYSKELIIEANMGIDDGDAFTNIDAYRRKVTRHEIIHAFLHESGLSEYCRDEDLVDWLAIQAPKMVKVFQEAEILD